MKALCLLIPDLTVPPRAVVLTRSFSVPAEVFKRKIIYHSKKSSSSLMAVSIFFITFTGQFINR